MARNPNEDMAGCLFAVIVMSVYSVVKHVVETRKEGRETLRRRRYWTEIREAVEQHEPSVFALSLEAARAEALRILEESKDWECRPLREQPSEVLTILAPSLQEVFNRWEEVFSPATSTGVTLPFGEEFLPEGWTVTSPGGDLRPLCITDTPDEQGALITYPGDERIYEVVLYHAARTPGEYKTYPSIWHWIIMKNTEVDVRRAWPRKDVTQSH